MEEMTIVASLDPEDNPCRLHMRIEVRIGIRAMVTMNISTEADLAKWYAWNHHRYNSGP